MSITDSDSVDLGIDHSGAIGNNDLVVAVQTEVGTFENHVRVTQRLGFARSGGPGALVWAGGDT